VLAAAGALALSGAAPNVVASGQWEGHAWRLEALDQDGRHCYRIAVDFPFTRASPPYAPNCAYPGHGAWNAFTVCPLAFVYGIADPGAVSLRFELATGKTVRVTTKTGRGVRYFAARIPCTARVVGLDQLSGQGGVVTRWRVPR